MKKKIFIFSLIAALVISALPVFGTSDVSAAVTALDAQVMENESNNNIGEANEIAVNTLIGANLSDRDDKDWFSFTLNSPGYVSITFYSEYINTSNSYWQMEMMTVDNKSFIKNYFVGNSNVKQDTNIVGLDKGTYYIFFEDYSYSDKQYAFTVNYTQADDWEKEFNDSLATANPLNTNAMVNGTLRNNDDKDWYSFELPSDGIIWFTFGNEFIDTSNSYWQTTIYNDSNTEIYKFYWEGRNQVDVTSKKMGLPAGKYYILLEDYSYSTKPYHFTVNYKATDSWEKEFNNTIATPNKIAVNSKVNGLLFDYNDKDWYSVSVSQKGMARISFDHEFVDTSNDYWKISIYNGNDCIDTTQFKGRDVVTAYSKTIDVSSGTYFILVEDYSFSDKEYSLAFEYTTSGSFDGISYDNNNNNNNNENNNNNNNNTEPDEDNTTSAAKGTKFTANGVSYKVTGDGEVTVTGGNSSSLVIPQTVTYSGNEYDVISITKNAFKKNSSITSVTINADLEYIGTNAFYNCKNLTNLTINGDVDTINSKAFYNCKKLKTININTDALDKVGSKAFYMIYKKAYIKVPSSCFSDYKKMIKNSKVKSTVKISKA